MIKLLHTADWQIGKLFGQFDPAEAALIADARFKSVERLAGVAVAHKVDLILVAGDVFDAQSVADKTIHRLFNCVKGYAGPWVIIPGNHDAGLSESVWTRAARLQAVPKNVHVLLRPESAIFESLCVAVLSAPVTQRNTHTDLTEWFASAETPPGMYRIGVAHGCAQGILAGDIDSTNPISAGRAGQAGLDYLALGDWHGVKQVDERTWYSGTPETDRFKANDSGRALLVELFEQGSLPLVTPIPIGQYCWHSAAMSLQVPSDLDEVLQRLTEFDEMDVVQLTLSGQTDLVGHRRLHEAIGKTQGRVRSLLIDQSSLRLEPTSNDINDLKADGYLAEVLSELQAGQLGPDQEISREAIVLLAGFLDERRVQVGVGGSH